MAHVGLTAAVRTALWPLGLADREWSVAGETHSRLGSRLRAYVLLGHCAVIAEWHNMKAGNLT